MKQIFFLFISVLCLACQNKAPKHPVYKIDLERPEVVRLESIFTSVRAVPFETNEKSHFLTGELGVKDGRYYILDRNQQLFFCFDTTGKFKYVLDNKPKDGKPAKDPRFRSILTPMNYYYQKKWYNYLIFRNIVYTKDKQGNQTIRYEWDFGPYNDDKEIVLRFPSMAPYVVMGMQKAWMKANSAFALSNARQSTHYIYTMLERNLPQDSLENSSRFFHILCYKPTGKCYFFKDFENGGSLGTELRLEGDCLLMLLPWWEKEKYTGLSLLDEQSRNVIQNLKAGDNPVLLKWQLKS